MELCGTKKQEQLGFGYVEDACFSNCLFEWDLLNIKTERLSPNPSCKDISVLVYKVFELCRNK